LALDLDNANLVQLDEVFHLPELLATVLFSGFFICLGNTAGNAIAFAKHVLLAANPTADRTTELDGRLISFVAVSILTVICLLHHFSQHMGLFLNRAFALYKIALLFVVFVAGVAARNKKPSGKSGFDTVYAGGNKGDSLAALVYILYSYQGWENANYVCSATPLA
jgi:amino acid transporter